jgi:hypothetical protein
MALFARFLVILLAATLAAVLISSRVGIMLDCVTN